MSLSKIKELTEKLYNEPNLCNWFQCLSVLIWNKTGFALNNKKLKLHEPTITHNLVFDFWTVAGLSNFPIKIFEAKDEKANGNDLEIILQTTSGYLYLPMQAKIIKRNSRYPGIKHQVKRNYQIDLLLAYAKKKKGLPFFLLYNYCNIPKVIKGIQASSEFDIECYGCSIVNAKYIKENYHNPQASTPNLQWKIPSFSDLHPLPAYPFHFLVCKDISTWASYYQAMMGQNEIKFYSEKEITEDPDWIDLAPGARIGFILGENQNNLFNYVESQSIEQFNPKYRIVISFERKQSALVRLS